MDTRVSGESGENMSDSFWNVIIVQRHCDPRVCVNEKRKVRVNGRRQKEER